MDPQNILQLALSSIIGSGLGTTIVGLLFNAKVSRELEIQKAFLTRASNVHARTVDTLSKLYDDLFKAERILKRMTAAGRMANEILPEEYAPLLSKTVDSAQEVFSSGRLFIPTPLVQQCESFFETVFEGRQEFAFAHLPAVDPAKQAEFWRKASTVAYEKVPKVLREIERAARLVIHGEQAT